MLHIVKMAYFVIELCIKSVVTVYSLKDKRYDD